LVTGAIIRSFLEQRIGRGTRFSAYLDQGTRNDLLEVLDDRVGSRSTIIINSMGKKNKPDDAVA